MGGWGYYDDENDSAADNYCDIIKKIHKKVGAEYEDSIEERLVSRSGAQLNEKDILRNNLDVVFKFIEKCLTGKTEMWWSNQSWASRASFTVGIVLRVVRELTDVPCGWFIHEDPDVMPFDDDKPDEKKLHQLGAIFSQYLAKDHGEHNPNIPVTRKQAIRRTRKLFGPVPKEVDPAIQQILLYLKEELGEPVLVKKENDELQNT